MIKPRTVNRAILAAALLCFAACGKKEESALTPVLSAPNAVEKISAQAGVKASSGPVELTFLLHKTQIKAGDYLWQQIRIRNVGDINILASDPVFNEPRELRKQSRSNYGIYLEALGPDGKPLKVEFQDPAEQGRDIGYGVSGFLEVEGREEQAMLDGWKKLGLSEREIGYKLIDFNRKKQRAAEKTKQWPGIELFPRQSAETKSAFYYSMQDKIRNRLRPSPIGEFSQLDFYIFEKPGEYKIRAIYDRAPTPELNRMRGKLPIYPEEVLIRTPWIKVTVTP